MKTKKKNKGSNLLQVQLNPNFRLRLDEYVTSVSSTKSSVTIRALKLYMAIAERLGSSKEIVIPDNVDEADRLVLDVFYHDL